MYFVLVKIIRDASKQKYRGIIIKYLVEGKIEEYKLQNQPDIILYYSYRQPTFWSCAISFTVIFSLKVVVVAFASPKNKFFTFSCSGIVIPSWECLSTWPSVW